MVETMVEVFCNIQVPERVVRRHVRYMNKNNLQSTTFYYKKEPVYIYMTGKNNA